MVDGASANAGVLEGAGDGRHAIEPDAFGQLPADLEVGIDAGIEPPEQLDEQPFAEHERRVALFAGDAPRHQVAFTADGLERRRLDARWICPMRVLICSCFSSASSSVRANRSSSQASNSTPLRAPVMLARIACPARSSSPRTSTCEQIVSGRK